MRARALSHRRPFKCHRLERSRFSGGELRPPLNDDSSDFQPDLTCLLDTERGLVSFQKFHQSFTRISQEQKWSRLDLFTFIKFLTILRRKIIFSKFQKNSKDGNTWILHQSWKDSILKWGIIVARFRFRNLFFSLPRGESCVSSI